ncbi:MAG: hypothetical protein K8T20_16755 [Planctomycetes bacterium]|nr:hypothetical protein [Planctomycetota bacterium]
MKRVAATKNACLATAGLVAAAALAYAMAFVVFPPVTPRIGYRDPGGRRLCEYPELPQDMSAVWTRKLGNVIEPITPPRFDASLAGTTTSSNPAMTFAAINTPTGQSLVRVGDRVQSARLDSIGSGSALFTLGGRSIPLMITRSEK